MRSSAGSGERGSHEQEHGVRGAFSRIRRPTHFHDLARNVPANPGPGSGSRAGTMRLGCVCVIIQVYSRRCVTFRIQQFPISL